MHGDQVQGRSEAVMRMVVGRGQDGDQECVEGLFHLIGSISGKMLQPVGKSAESAVRLVVLVSLVPVSECWTLNESELYASVFLCLNTDSRNAYGG